MSDSVFRVSEPFAPRSVSVGPIVEVGGWRLKSYGVAYLGDAGDASTEPALGELVSSVLPSPPVGPGRPGAGFAILHCGRGVDYLVLGWWDRENELPVQVWVRSGDAAPWRRAADRESFCVWDLEIITHERNAYVTHVLTDGSGDVARYLSDTFRTTT